MPISMMIQSLVGARTAGLDIPRLLQKSGIDPQVLDQSPQNRIPLEQYVLLSRYTSGAMNDEIAGLFEKPLRLGHFRILALSVVHTATIGDALKRTIEFINLFENSLHYQLQVSGNQVELVLTRLPEHTIANTYAIESVLTVHHRFLGWLANERIILNQVKLDYPAPEYKDEYRHMFYGAPVLFNQHHTSLQFDKSYMARPIVQNEASVESYVRRAPMDVYLPLDAGGKVTIEVRNKVNEHFLEHDKPPELHWISGQVGLNPQSLRRQLKREDTSFHVIKAQVRRDIAIHHLGAGELSIEDTAYKAGYTEAGAFIRAFKTWTGFTPYNFRKGLMI